MAEKEDIQTQIAEQLSGLPSACGRGPLGPVGPKWNDTVQDVDSSPDLEEIAAETQIDLEAQDDVYMKSLERALMLSPVVEIPDTQNHTDEKMRRKRLRGKGGKDRSSTSVAAEVSVPKNGSGYERPLCAEEGETCSRQSQS